MACASSRAPCTSTVPNWKVCEAGAAGVPDGASTWACACVLAARPASSRACVSVERRRNEGEQRAGEDAGAQERGWRVTGFGSCVGEHGGRPGVFFLKKGSGFSDMPDRKRDV